MSIDRNFDMDLFGHTRQYAEHLRDAHSQRNADMDANEQMWKLNWDDQEALEKRFPGIFVTISPDPRTAVEGVVRLMCATEPQIRVPKEIEGEENKELSSRIEKLCRAMLRASGRAKGDPLHYDVVRSGTIYDEIHITVDSVKEMAEIKEGVHRARAQKLAERCPVILNVTDPRKGYPDWDEIGLTGFLREYKMYARDILSAWGEYGKLALGDYQDNAKWDGYTEYEIADMYDLEYRTIWFKDSDVVIVQTPVEDGLIPVCVTLVQGSRMWDRPEDQREGMLYTMRKSGMWRRQCLSYTALFTKVAEFGLSPAMIYEPADEDEEGPEVDTTGKISFIRKPQGSRLEPWNAKGLIDDAAYRAIEIAERKGTEMTIYRQALGQPIAGSVAYSTYALLSQSGRLPLVILQKKASWAIGDAMRLALQILKRDGGTARVGASGVFAEMPVSEIPESIEIEATLDLALPQDKLSNARIGQMVKSDNLASMEWVRENFLQIENSEEMDAQIMSEMAEWAGFMQYLQQSLASQQPAANSQQVQPPAFSQQGQAGQQGGMGPGVEGIPAEMMDAGMGEPEQPEMAGGGM